MKKNNKGFTLMEMLIVVAIIAVLVAIAIPTFTSALEKSREATDAANLRAAYAEVTVAALTEEDTNTATGVTRDGNDGAYTWTKEVKLVQKQKDWQNKSYLSENGNGIGGAEVTNNIAVVGATINVTFTQSTGKVTFEVKG